MEAPKETLQSETVEFYSVVTLLSISHSVYLKFTKNERVGQRNSESKYIQGPRATKIKIEILALRSEALDIRQRMYGKKN